MRENRTSGLTRGSNGTGANRPLLSTLLVKITVTFLENPQIMMRGSISYFCFKLGEGNSGFFQSL
jgi:hypothetical protein